MTTLTVTLSVTIPEGAPPLPYGAGERLALRVADGLRAHIDRRAAARAGRLAADLAREGIAAEHRSVAGVAAAHSGAAVLRP